MDIAKLLKMLRSENEPTQKKQAESMIVCILQSTGVIDIASEDLMGIDLENLFEIIRKHTITISCFKLNLATLDADGFMHKFLKCLASQPSLKSLDLSSCRISDGNMQFLLYRLSDLNLTDLNLNETYFNCLESIRDSLSQKNTLISLKLRGNFISYPGYTMTHDDGQSVKDLDKADVVVLGISRTSKTPTSIYLAQRGVRVANVPVVPGIPLPEALFELRGKLIVGLIASAERIAQIRRHRLLALNEARTTEYVDPRHITQEIVSMKSICTEHRWPLIDVTRRSVEETAASFLGLLDSTAQKSAP